jgi:mRNA-degrading endonuclease RelE of RelBE toxin-antitoxin system
MPDRPSLRNHVEIDPAAERDLRRMGPGPQRQRIIRVLAAALEPAPPPGNTDIRALVGYARWLRLRVGDWRVVYRPLRAEELAAIKDARGEIDAADGYLVYRIVHRRELERSVRALPQAPRE